MIIIALDQKRNCLNKRSKYLKKGVGDSSETPVIHSHRTPNPPRDGTSITLYFYSLDVK